MIYQLQDYHEVVFVQGNDFMKWVEVSSVNICVDHPLPPRPFIDAFVTFQGQCCGIRNWTDFQGAQKWQKLHPTQQIPVTCCKGVTVDNPTPNDSTCFQAPTVMNSNMNKVSRLGSINSLDF